MGLRLRIENETRLPDGGPLDISVSGRRGIDIGRDPHLDWTLPDSSRQISGKHCEVRFVDGDYLLYDVSTNGTFLNGSDRRMQAPHVIRSGDRILIGNYIVSAEVTGERSAPPRPVEARPSPGGGQDLWSGSADAAPPGARSDFIHREPEAYARPDFLDWAADVPAIEPTPQPAGSAAREAELRAVWVDAEPTGAWALSKPTPAPIEPQPVPERAPPPKPEAPVAKLPSAADPWPEAGSAPPPPPMSPATAPQPDAAVPPAPAAAQSPSAIQPGGMMSAEDALARVARAAGVSRDAFAKRDPGETLDDLGATTRVAVECMMRLLAARSGAKREMRSSEYTTIGAQDNNPLKFAPGPEDAIAILFGPPMRSYLGGRAAFAKGFEDIAGHQVRVFAAMQQAVKMLLADLDPTMIEQSANVERGLAGMFGSQKGRLWDQYLSVWNTKAAVREDGLAGLFMEYFSKCYDRLGSSKVP